MPVIFIPRETREGERRVAATPATVKKFHQEGFGVRIEKDAGEGAFFSDAQFVEAGARIVERPEEGFGEADIVAMINPPEPSQIVQMKRGSSVVSFLFAHLSAERVEALREREIRAFRMEAIPRISRAQKYDALSSQANLAGYAAVIVAAGCCPKIFPLLMTAAGTLRPVQVVVIGAGVAGLQAVATARRLGANVEVSDVRCVVKEQVESLGASFIAPPTTESLEDSGGYAKSQSEEFLRRQGEILGEHLSSADVVISTAQVPGKKAPVIILEEMVRTMRPGSVIVDLAAEQGGNCELTQAGQTLARHGVTIVGETNLPSRVATHASQAYARNILNIILDQPREQGSFSWDPNDEVVTEAMFDLSDGSKETLQLESLTIRSAPSTTDEQSAEEESAADQPSEAAGR